MGGQIISFIILAGTLVLWVLGAVRYFSGGSKGVQLFFFHLILCAATIFTLWAVILYPVLDCREFLCGLGELLLFLLLSAVVALGWGIYLFVSGKKYADASRTNSSAQILDENLDEEF